MVRVQEEKEFRFSTRAEYENELVRLIQLQRRSSKKSEEYEELLEEYLRFCDSAEGEDGE